VTLWLPIGLLSAAIAYAALKGGGDQAYHSAIALVIIGVAAIIWATHLAARRGPAPARGRAAWVDVAALALPLYVAFQLLPLPAAVVGWLSPARAELASALSQLAPQPSFIPLSTSAAYTTLHLARTLAAALTFIVLRHSVRPDRPWIAAMPLLMLAAAEAWMGFEQSNVPGKLVAGTYAGRNHYAGLLALALPLAAGCGVACLMRVREEGRSDWRAGALGLASLSAAPLLFFGLAVSLSKGAIVSVIGSLLVVGAAWGLSTALGFKRATAGGVVMAIAGAVVLLSLPPQFVERFAEFTSDDVSEGRFGIWQNTLRLVGAYPLTGVGLGNFYPNIMRYQTTGLGYAWTATHNDYLQLVSELGIVGAIFPAIVVGIALIAAFRKVTSAELSSERMFGLACVGSLSAFLLHALTEFNWYVLANSLAAAWVAALAASTTTSVATTLTGGGRLPGGAFRRVVAGMGIALAAYGSATVAYAYDRRPVAEKESQYCRFGICDTAAAMADLRGPRRYTDPRPVPSRVLLKYLSRHPANAFQWAEVGEALSEEHRLADAEYAFRRAVSLAPRSPFELALAADFFLARNQQAAAFELLRRAFGAGAVADNVVFGTLLNHDVSMKDVLAHVLPDGRSGAAYVQRLIRERQGDDALKVWSWVVERGSGSQAIAANLTNFLLGEQRLQDGATAWRLYAVTQDGSYWQPNRVFNGSFESEPTQSPFDWRIHENQGVQIDWDSSVHGAGARSLRLHFDGTKNVGPVGVEQALYVTEGRYQLRAAVRTTGLSTNRGVHLRIRSTPSASVDATTSEVRSAGDWRVVTTVATIPAGGAMLTLSIERSLSLKFDSLIEGTVWIDDVTLVPLDESDGEER